MQIIDNSKNYLKELDKRMQAAVSIIGGMAEGHAKDAAPVDTGLLRNSITHGGAGGKLGATSYTSDDGSVSGEYASGEIPQEPGGEKYVVVVGTNVSYAAFQELGTTRMAAHPFLRPAFEGYGSEYKQVVERLLNG